MGHRPLCGILAYIGREPAAPLLVRLLKKLEYRGYDSAGIATVIDSAIHMAKDVGRVDEIASHLDLTSLRGFGGIAHTRWATHGGVTPENAHPHLSCDGRIAIVHNGIIDNYKKLREELENRNHSFRSGTDSEILAHLLEDNYDRAGNEITAVSKTVQKLSGSYAFVALFRQNPDVIAAARKDSPLMIGLGDGENFFASDVGAFIDRTDRAVFVDNREIALINTQGFKVTDFNGVSLRKLPTDVAREVSDVSREDFAHFTEKEIHEQSQTINRALIQTPEKILAVSKELAQAERIYLIASGTSYHAALLGKIYLAKFARRVVEVSLSSEFRDLEEFLDDHSVIVAISQSGETADILEAVGIARQRGARVVALINAEESSLSRTCDLSLSINCGPEIGVAATKSFTSQITLLNFLASQMAQKRRNQVELETLSKKVDNILAQDKVVRRVAHKFNAVSDLYFIGRGVHYPIALEGALKMKELSYIHAEGLSAGELKHGTLALVTENTPVVALNPEDATYEETLNSVSELKARGARVIGVSNRVSTLYDDFIQIPSVPNDLFPIIEVIPLQLLAYYAALERQADPDYPRNLAKSVTVK
ncbi:MAG: glutamine--fructose-6-phosphate transaminase (isomerizing) [Thaumarchaeota archaeon]|nr:glutamine--fructose-6-phosphate transaminase (isomerizing) [Nitrososphaerota archaeon]